MEVQRDWGPGVPGTAAPASGQQVHSQIPAKAPVWTVYCWPVVGQPAWRGGAPQSEQWGGRTARREQSSHSVLRPQFSEHDNLLKSFRQETALRGTRVIRVTPAPHRRPSLYMELMSGCCKITGLTLPSPRLRFPGLCPLQLQLGESSYLSGVTGVTWDECFLLNTGIKLELR